MNEIGPARFASQKDLQSRCISIASITGNRQVAAWRKETVQGLSGTADVMITDKVGNDL